MFDRWLYVSTCQLAAGRLEDCVRDIVEVSVLRNRTLDVTGALLFTGQKFTQYIEGPPASVAALKQSICRDSRHSSVTTLTYGPFDHRRFLGWSLAYAGPSRFVAAMVEDALNGAISGGEDKTESLAELLAGFVIDGHS
jgi:hypothetical protein